MLKKVGLWIIAVFITLSTYSIAGVYVITDELKQEIASNLNHFKNNPDSLDARFNLAMSYAYTGQIRKGWTTLRKIPKEYASVVIKKYQPLHNKHPEEWKYPFKLAFGYFFQGDKEKAIELFEDVLKIDPEHVWAMGFIALIKGEMGKVDEAIAVCKKALKIEPNATAIHFLLAEGYRKKEEYVKFLSEMMIVGRLQAEEALLNSE